MSETIELDQKSDPQAVKGYAFYDWAKSAFETSVTVAVLPAWYAYLFLKANGLTTTIGSIEMQGDAVWSFAVAFGTLFIAIISPSLGVIADRRRIKMWWLRILTYVGAGSTFLLAFAPLLPVDTQWIWLMVFFMLANVGLNGAGVFYNALLPHMGTDDEMDRISNLAFAYGYLGGGLLLLVHLIMVLSLTGDWVIPFVMASSGIWWYGFALVTFKLVPEPPIENEMPSLGFVSSAKLAISEIRKTLSEVQKFRTLFIYMLAYFFFIDGINSVTALGGVFGSTVLGITTVDLIVTILAIQFVAWPSALMFTSLSNGGKIPMVNLWGPNRFKIMIINGIGTKRALNVSLVGWVILCFAALSFAPLEYTDHTDYQVQIEEVDGEWFYTPHANILDTPIALVEGGDEQIWAESSLLSWGIVQQNEDISDAIIYEWAGFDDDGNAIAVSIASLTPGEITSLTESFEDTRFSISVRDTSTMVGIDHPTNLGDGVIDFIPETVRDKVWGPLQLSVGIQFLILGCAMGTLLGGSQGLARSMFGQMVPETRSAEFFGFFGFFGKVAAFIGPLLYGFMTVMYDSRMGILSIAVLILIGAVMMRMVDLEEGRLDAQAEDARNRGITIPEE
ncbi:TPA: MFS transporter [Candidatus Thalassarchaeaceae archaeon]|nr:MFS transporter [Euryarchaeota archaeon]MDG1548247.1 MFS transporter [Candidatus Thalassarchaeaceae archaeon]HII42775.1 MFS transporter [Candidatus Thalassarchaeaceae archaeon]